MTHLIVEVLRLDVHNVLVQHLCRQPQHGPLQDLYFLCPANLIDSTIVFHAWDVVPGAVNSSFSLELSGRPCLGAESLCSGRQCFVSDRTKFPSLGITVLSTRTVLTLLLLWLIALIRESYSLRRRIGPPLLPCPANLSHVSWRLMCLNRSHISLSSRIHTQSLVCGQGCPERHRPQRKN